ncbi:MAG: CDP-alcohol phosphatidyltransferase family protein [Stackebrandtia sp.]
MQRASREQVLSTYKERDAWWTVFLVDPLAGPLLRLVSPWRFVTPNALTIAAFALGLGSAWLFYLATWQALVAGALLFHVSFTLDCMDGKLARLRGAGSLFGGWLDYIFDRLRVLACTLGLFGGQFAATDNPVFLYVGVGVVFCDMFRYLNALYLKETRRDIRAKLAAASGVSAEQVRLQDESQLELSAQDAAGDASVVDAQQSFKQRFGWFAAMRDFLVRRRVRSHLFSGVEFQMAVFIVAPLTGWVLPVVAASVGLLLLVEAAVTYKQYLSVKDVHDQVAAAGSGG